MCVHKDNEESERVSKNNKFELPQIILKHKCSTFPPKATDSLAENLLLLMYWLFYCLTMSYNQERLLFDVQTNN